MQKVPALTAQIVQAGFAIGAIQIAPSMEALFEGPKGPIPVLNDTRLHVSYPSDRKMILTALLKLITPDMAFDAIAGTATAGLPWATLLSQELNKPLVHIHKNHAYQIHIPTSSSPKEIQLIEANEIIAGGGTFGIPQAVVLAHAFNKGMIYVRTEKPAFGKQIEGAYEIGQQVLLVKNHPFTSKKQLHHEKTLFQADLDCTVHQGSTRFDPDVPLKGKKILIVDDLIGNGGSIDEALVYRHHGAEVSNIICLFDQSREIARSKLSQENLTLKSVASFEDIMAVAVADGHMERTLIPQYRLWVNGTTHWVREAQKLEVKEKAES